MSDTGAFYGDFGVAEASARRRRAKQSVANQNAAAFGQLRGTRNIADLQRQYKEGFAPQVASYGRRGLGGPNVSSGIRTAGLEKYAASLQRDLGRETENMNAGLQQSMDAEAVAQSDLEDYLAQLRLQQQGSVLQTAIDIKSQASY
jgi:hypothetical protein